MDEDYIERPFPAFDGEGPFIFVSYAHKDRKIVFPEIDRFHMEGYPIWYDEGLVAGQEWDDEIAEALLACSLVVVFISKNSMASSNVQDEIKLALVEKIDIVPIYLEDVKLPLGLRLRLSNKHAIFKHTLSDQDYIRDCFKAFDKAKIPKIKEFVRTSSDDSSVDEFVSELSKSFNPFHAYEGDAHYIFASYKHQDFQKVYPVIEKLHDAGINIWYDNGISLEENYTIQIADRIENSSLFVTFITEEVIRCSHDENDFLVKETRLARNKPCLAIFIDDVNLEGFYLMHYFGKQSIFKFEFADEEMFIDACIDAFKEYGIEPNK